MNAGSAVVTGGARGIGRGIAERLVSRGYAVVVTDVDGPAAQACAEEIGAAEGLALDVRDPQAHRDAAAAAGRHDALTAWFNNAGVGDDGTVAELSDEAVRRLVEVNLLGTLWGMRAALAAFGPRGGDVVNTASLSGLGPVPGYSVYAATKAGIVSVSMSAAAEAPRGVRVHALCPDGVQTALLDAQTAGGSGGRARPLGRSDPHRRRDRRCCRRVARVGPGGAHPAGLARRAAAGDHARAVAGREGDRGVRRPGAPGDRAGALSAFERVRTNVRVGP